MLCTPSTSGYGDAGTERQISTFLYRLGANPPSMAGFRWPPAVVSGIAQKASAFLNHLRSEDGSRRAYP
ncbi:hypothetical protein V2G26_016122 [Clonostachys chloroleuca]